MHKETSTIMALEVPFTPGGFAEIGTSMLGWADVAHAMVRPVLVQHRAKAWGRAMLST